MRPTERSSATETRCRPAATQELLLRACLWTTRRRWPRGIAGRASVDLDRIDEESLRLLPLACFRLQGAAARDRTLEIAKGVYRRAWYQNQLLLRTLSGVLDVLADAGIDAMLLKGVSLATRYYPSIATRPMVDIDLLVPHRDAERAVALLGREGFSPIKHTPTSRLVGYAHGLALKRGQCSIDLHWNALWPQRRADADGPFWERAHRIQHDGRPAFALAPTDELFHACMHGARLSQNAYSWAPSPLVRWIVDAFMIARRSEIDWQRIAALAERFHARLHLRDAFLYLRDGLGFQVPDALLAEWARARSPADELHYELALAPRPPRFFATLPRFRFWKSYRMKTYIEEQATDPRRASLLRHLAGFPPYVIAFVKADLDVERLRDVPGKLARKLASRPSLLRP